MNRLCRALAIVLLAATVLSVLPLPLGTPNAHAAVLTWEMNTELLAALGVTAAEQTAITGQTFLEWAQKFLLDTLKRQLLDMMVDQIIQWIQGGGKPQFVTDWRQFLSDAANVATGDFIQEIGLGFLCSPFSLQVQISLLPVGKFTKQITCTLDQIVGNIDNFFGDFRNGGWIAYTNALEPKNNYFGASLLAEADLERRRENARSAALSEGLSGGGFLSTKSCNEGTGSGPDLDRDGTPGDIASSCTITTPGDTIGGLVSKAVGSDIDYLVNADQLSAYVSSIANAIINRIIVEGVNGLQGVTSPNAPSGGVVSGGIGNCNGLSGSVLTACLDLVQNSQNSFGSAQFKVLQDIQLSRTARKDADIALKSSVTELTNYMASLRNLTGLLQSANCANLSLCVSKIDAELTFASSTIPAVQNDIALNQAIITQLDGLETQVNAVVQDDWAALSSLLSQVQQSGATNLTQATAVQTSAEQELTDIRDRIVRMLQKFNGYLLQCQQGSLFACQ
ncbi:MAG: hypothetical protein AAB518_00280 [Patescibacteria group bacterium]